MNRNVAAPILAFGFLLGLEAHAHPISISRASVYFTRTEATAEIEIFLEDLYLFHQLKPSQDNYLDEATIRDGIGRHREFLRERFEIRDVEGHRIEPVSIDVEQTEIPSEGVAIDQLMAHRLTYVLKFKLPNTPRVLHFSQRFTEEEAVLPSEMNLVLQQEGGGTPVTHTLLPREPFALRIDWSNPPLAADASAREQEAWRKREKESLLGITNASRAYSFLYIEDNQVRHEILVPLLSLAEELQIDAAETPVLDVAQQELIRPQLEDYFRKGNPIIIDDQTSQPVVKRCDLFALDTTDFAVATTARSVPLAGCRAGVILSYPLQQAPQRLQMTWDRFNDKIWGVTAVVIDGDEISRAKLAKVGGRNTVTWSRVAASSPLPEVAFVPVQVKPSPSFSVPWLMWIFLVLFLIAIYAAGKNRSGFAWAMAVALLLCGFAASFAPRVDLPIAWIAAPPPSDGEARAIFHQLHTHLYRAFDRRREDAVYDALAKSVDGDLLQKTYLEVREGLVMEDQGGARARINRVELVETERVADPYEAGRFAIRCRWNVSGSVEHWGHLHQRTNQYHARFAAAAIDGNWKFTDMQLLDQQRVRSATTLK